jgi:heterodisulfide reductase subunit A2
MKKKIGVYVCHCGGNISDYVDIEKVKQAVKEEDGVFLVKNTLFACADSSQKEMVADIQSNGLDAIVIASCSPKLHLTTFRNVASRAGLNPYNYVQVNIREQGSWAHSDNKAGATLKAIQLVKSGIARAYESEALTSKKIPATNAIAVIGAGIGGMRSALALADMGTEVTLIEKEHYVGGRTAQWGCIFPTDTQAAALTESLYRKIKAHQHITLFTGAEMVEKKGSIGDFDIKIRIKPRHFQGIVSPEKQQKALNACPVEVDDEFNFGLTKRKAILQPGTGQFPQQPAIDMSCCNHCGNCEKECSNFHLMAKDEILSLNVGGVIVNTGFDPYQPLECEYGYGKLENVITLPQFKRLIELSEKELLYKGKEIRKIAYIYCIGSRQDEDGENKYCSRYCCTSAIHSAVLAKSKYKGITNLHFNRGIRTYGKQELIYEQSSKNGDIYLQFTLDSIPEIEQRDSKTFIKVKDILTEGKTLETDADLIVLVTGMVPRENNGIASLLKIPVGRDRFFNEVHMKLRPVETVIDGVFIAGACQSPKNILETMNSSMAAAAKANSVLTKGELSLEPVLAKLNPSACTWCGKCLAACSFDAVAQVEYEGRMIARINESNCKGCGMCTPVCPTDAIDLAGFTNSQIEAMIDALAES